MSRASDLGGVSHQCFPRVSGDEPYLSESMGVSNEFSPRERG